MVENNDLYQCSRCGQKSNWEEIKKVNPMAKYFTGRLFCPRCGGTFSVGFDQYLTDNDNG